MLTLTRKIEAFIDVINLALGLWLAACPWILGFHGDTMAMQVHFAVGVVVATIAIC